MYYDLNELADQQQLTVTTTPTTLPEPRVSSGVKMPNRVIVQALSTNTASIFLKNKDDVQQDGSTGGTEIPPGFNLVLAIKDYRQFYVVAASACKLQVSYLGGI